jgi:2-dehydro-3-deoxygluconokinase
MNEDGTDVDDARPGPRSPRIDVLCVGETLALLVPDPPARLAAASIMRLDIAGAEANVASHLAKDGVRAAWAGAVGSDPFGERILGTLTSRGFDVSAVKVDPEAPTGVLFKDPIGETTRVHYYRAGSAASRLGADFAATLPMDAAVMHLTGITPALSASCRELVEELVGSRRTGTLLSFDVNYRPALWHGDAAEILRTIATECDLVFVGLDEASALWGVETPAEIAAMLPGARVVVKDGAVGAHVLGGDRAAFVPASPVEVVEPVGAGDAFAAGFLAAQLRGGDDHDSLANGHRYAARALSTLGDF